MSAFIAEIKEYMISCLKDKYEADITNKENIDDMDLLGSGVISSLGYIELITGIEDHFKIEIDFDEVDPAEYSTLSGLVSLAAKARENLNE